MEKLKTPTEFELLATAANFIREEFEKKY